MTTETKNQDITVTVTSCNRFDLLEISIKSLLKFWDGKPPIAFYINEDSGLEIPKSIGEFIKDFWPEINYVEFAGKGDQIKALDRMYQAVTTPYVMQMECDWEFYRTGFIKASLEALERHPRCINLWLREPNDTNGHPHKNGILINNYNRMWGGFTFNPTLKRMSDYKRLIKYSSHTIFDKLRPWESESKISMMYRRLGYFAMIGEKGYVRHLGENRHVIV